MAASDARGGGGSFERSQALDRLAGTAFDVLVIGGGITGAGVALDAASRGLATALVEKGDFASGTSSKSSKMVHGGLRYLQQREVALVYENLAERQRLLENAPHLVSPLPFLIPLFGQDGVVSKTVARSYATALWLYDLTGGVRIGDRHHRISRQEALAQLPQLKVDHLVAGFLYLDARADDARLTLDVLRTATSAYGAVAANYTEVTGLVRSGPKVTGAEVSPRGHPPFEIRAEVVVSATGVWAEEVAHLAGGDGSPKLRPAKGIHVTVPADRLAARTAAVIPVPEDRRSIFVVPWPETDLVYLGTTDTGYEGPTDDPACTPDDVAYLLDAANRVTTADLTPADVTGVWAGLRPLLASDGDGRAATRRTADLSRRHRVTMTDQGVITVTGGKLTTYRRMAEDTVDRIVTRRFGERATARRPCVTQHLALLGSEGYQRERGIWDALLPGRRPILPPTGPVGLEEHLHHRYGSESAKVLRLADGRPELLEPVVDGLPYVGAEVVYAGRHEMAQTLDDVLSRRTRARLQLAERSIDAAPRVARLLGEELGWDDEQVRTEVHAYQAAVRHELDQAGVAGATATPEPRAS